MNTGLWREEANVSVNIIALASVILHCSESITKATAWNIYYQETGSLIC